MACGFLNHIGTFLLLAASIFLLVTTISAPIVNNIGILTVNLPENVQGKEVAFGTFGWCIEDGSKSGGDLCSNTTVGYNPAAEMNRIDGTDFASYSELTTKALTRAMVLHPVATVLNFVAFLLAAFSGMIGSFVATIVSSLALLLTLVVLLCDFVLFGIIRSEVNDQDPLGGRAYFSIGMWTVLVSAICSLLGTIIVFFTCCAGRVKRRREARKMEPTTSPVVTEKPKAKWQFWKRS